MICRLNKPIVFICVDDFARISGVNKLKFLKALENFLPKSTAIIAVDSVKSAEGDPGQQASDRWHLIRDFEPYLTGLALFSKDGSEYCYSRSNVYDIQCYRATDVQVKKALIFADMSWTDYVFRVPSAGVMAMTEYLLNARSSNTLLVGAVMSRVDYVEDKTSKQTLTQFILDNQS